MLGLAPRVHTYVRFVAPLSDLYALNKLVYGTQGAPVTAKL